MAKRSSPDDRTLDPAGFVTRAEFLEAHAGLKSEIGGMKAEIGGLKTERLDARVTALEAEAKARLRPK